MKKTRSILLAVLISFVIITNAQVAINNDNSTPNTSTVLDVSSSNKGILMPRMTQAEIAAIINPADGLIVFNKDDNRLYSYSNTDGEWKAFAISNDTITPIPPSSSFVCGTTLTDTRDNNDYNTIQIGCVCWMAENLNIGIRIEGANDQTNNDTIEKYCNNNDTANCIKYGGLYQWDEMMQYASEEGVQGICPDGWHIPTDDEWKTLEMHLGMSYNDAEESDLSVGIRGTDEGDEMKATSGWYNYYGSNGGSNSSGFTGKPGGMRYNSWNFYYLEKHGLWWSSSENSSNYAWKRALHYDSDLITRKASGKYLGISIRCVMN